MTDKEKIKQYIDYKGVSKNRFYKQTGLSIGFLDSGSSLGVDKLRIIIDNYHDLNPLWILTGQGEMLNQKPSNKEIDRNVDKSKVSSQLPISNSPNVGYDSQEIVDKLASKNQEAYVERELNGVPFFNKPINSRLMSTFKNPAKEADFVIDIPAVNDCDFWRPVFGDSMENKFSPGSWVVCKKQSNTDVIFFGNSYLVETNGIANNMQIIRTIRKHENDDYVVLCPESNKHDNITIPKKAITALYIVKGSFDLLNY